LRALPAGRGGVVAVEAAAGLGKTTLLRHLRTAAQEAGCTVLSACGAELEQDFTFGAVRQLFGPVPPRPATPGCSPVRPRRPSWSWWTTSSGWTCRHPGSSGS
jgi:hypothetical protein